MDVNSALPNPILRFKDGIARNTARIPQEKWEAHKELLCSLYREKTINEILLVMWAEHGFAANAGQLGRKLRKWGAYKYDGKNRPLDTACHTSEDINVPESAPAILSDEAVPGDTNDEATATANSGMKFSQCVDKVIGAYHDAISLTGRLVETKETEEPKRSLQSSLSTQSFIIERHYKRGFENFGTDYARGDSQAREQMESIFLILKSVLLPSLQQEVKNQVATFYVYDILLSESELNRYMASACLEALYHRLSVAATAVVVDNDLPPKYNPPYPVEPDWMPETLAHPAGWPELVPKFPGVRGPSSWASQPLEGSAPFTVPAMSTVVEEPEDGGTLDIDMDRFSAMSLAPSSLSGFSSLRSLARRIRFRNSSSDRYSMDDPPSNVMNWNRSSSSLELFGQLSDRWSIASSQKTGSSWMSGRPELPSTEAKGNSDAICRNLVRDGFLGKSEALGTIWTLEQRKVTPRLSVRTH